MYTGCAFNFNGCGCSRCSNNWGCNPCQTTYNRCNCCQTTYNTCRRNYGCVTICGNLSALFGGGTTSCQDAYYSRLYGLNTTAGNGCGCTSGYNFEQTQSN